MQIVVVPQWFGSGSADARRIAEGGRRLAERLAVPAEFVLDLPADPADDELVEGIRRFPVIAESARRTRALLAGLTEPPIVVGGECGLEWGALGAADRTRTAVVWFDSHPDFNTPATSPSGSFHGMVLRRLVDEGLPVGNVVLAGTRSFDEAERTALGAAGLAAVPPGSLVDGVIGALERIGPDDVWIHVDVDVLDPAEFASVGFPEPDGVRVSELLATIAAVRARSPLAGAAVTEFAPGPGPDAEADLATVVRIVDGLRGAVTA